MSKALMQGVSVQCTLAIMLAMSAGSCGLSDTEPCTLIGCEGGLWIRLGEPTAGPVSARAVLPDGTVLEAECVGEFQCSGGLFFANVTVPSALLEIEIGGAVRTLQVALTYIEARPNGPDCPPPCPIATVDLKSLT
jgi:hypothetical protein